MFGDITSRVPVDLLGHLNATEQSFLEKAAGLLKNATMSKDEKAHLKDKWGAEMMSAMFEALKDAKFASKDWCYKHNAMCPLLPTLTERCERAEVAGTTCVAWSSMRPDTCTGQWIHESTLPCLVWLFWVLKAAPSWYIHECVPGFDAQALMQVLSTFMTVSVVFSPSLFGLPSNRQRRYTFGVNSERCAWNHELPFPGTDGSGLTSRRVKSFFTRMFEREIQVGCEVYLTAPETLLVQYIRACAEEKGASVDPATVDVTICLSGAHFQRLIAYKQLLRDTQSDSPFRSFIFNLEQTSGYHASISHIVPALLTKSKLCVLHAVSDAQGSANSMHLPSSKLRVVLPIEHFGILGFPMAFLQGSSLPAGGARWANFSLGHILADKEDERFNASQADWEWNESTGCWVSHGTSACRMRALRAQRCVLPAAANLEGDVASLSDGNKLE